MQQEAAEKRSPQGTRTWLTANVSNRSSILPFCLTFPPHVPINYHPFISFLFSLPPPPTHLTLPFSLSHSTQLPSFVEVMLSVRFKKKPTIILWSVYKISVIYTYLGTNCKWEYDYQTWYVPYTMKKQQDYAFQTFLWSHTSSADEPCAVRWGIYDFTACFYCNLGSVCPLWNKASIPW